jgi:hypothetical protein
MQSPRASAPEDVDDTVHSQDPKTAGGDGHFLCDVQHDRIYPTPTRVDTGGFPIAYVFLPLVTVQPNELEILSSDENSWYYYQNLDVLRPVTICYQNPLFADLVKLRGKSPSKSSAFSKSEGRSR